MEDEKLEELITTPVFKTFKNFPIEAQLSIADLPGEIWKDIEGFDNYEISNYCRVRAKKRFSKKGAQLPPRILAFSEHKDGYVFVRLNRTVDGKTKVHKVSITNLYNQYFRTYISENLSTREFENRKELNLMYRDPQKYQEDGFKNPGEMFKRNPKQTVTFKNKCRFKTFNIYTKEERYYRTTEDIEEELHIPQNIIERLINQEISSFLNIKIYMVEKKGWR